MRWIQVDVVRLADCLALVEIVVGFSLSKKRSTCERDLQTDICLSNSAEEASGISFSKHSPLKPNVSFANLFLREPV